MCRSFRFVKTHPPIFCGGCCVLFSASQPLKSRFKRGVGGDIRLDRSLFEYLARARLVKRDGQIHLRTVIHVIEHIDARVASGRCAESPCVFESSEAEHQSFARARSHVVGKYRNGYIQLLFGIEAPAARARIADNAVFERDRDIVAAVVIINQFAVWQQRRDSRRHRTHVTADVAAQVEHNALYFIAVLVNEVLRDFCVFLSRFGCAEEIFGCAEEIGEFYYCNIDVERNGWQNLGIALGNVLRFRL